ncbi:CcmD family protein [Cytobacillus spongiae]|nr:CcmD family protein [Cytobacillus spongiae]UII55270.1 CcmD family protein [Cytobacillus spongiae]
MEYLYLAYTVIWALIGGYIVVLGKRQHQLKKDLEVLKEWNSEQ